MTNLCVKASSFILVSFLFVQKVTPPKSFIFLCFARVRSRVVSALGIGIMLHEFQFLLISTTDGAYIYWMQSVLCSRLGLSKPWLFFFEFARRNIIIRPKNLSRLFFI